LNKCRKKWEDEGTDIEATIKAHIQEVGISRYNFSFAVVWSCIKWKFLETISVDSDKFIPLLPELPK